MKSISEFLVPPDNASRVTRFVVYCYAVYAVIQLICPVVMPIHGHDSDNHLFWIRAFSQNVHDGILYPRWLSQSFEGFGASTFYYYPPITYYLATLFTLIAPSASPETTYHLVGWVGSVFALIGSYLLLKRLGLSGPNARFGSLLYSFSIYSFFDLYVRGALSEHTALAIVPFLFLAIENVLQANAKLRPSILLAFIWGLLIMTSVPTAVVVGISGPIYFMVRLRRSPKARFLPWLFGGALSGTLLTALYSLPVFAFYPLLNHAALVPKFDNSTTGNPLLDLILGKNLISIDIYCTIFLLGGLIILLNHRRKKSASTPEGVETPSSHSWAALGWLAILMQIPYIVLPLYAFLLPFSLIQQSFRWDVVLSLSIAVLVARAQKLSLSRVSAAVLLSWSLIGSVLLVMAVENVRLHLTPIHYVSDPIEYIPPKAAGTASVEWLGQHSNDPLVAASDTCIQILRAYQNSNGIEADIMTANSSLVTFHEFFWPQMELTIDSHPASLGSDSSGRATARIPAGRHSLELRIGRSDSEMVGAWISLGMLLSLLIAYLFAAKDIAESINSSST